MRLILGVLLLCFSCLAMASWTLSVKYYPGIPMVGGGTSDDMYVVKVINWDQNDPSYNPLKYGCGIISGYKCGITLGYQYIYGGERPQRGYSSWGEGAVEIPDGDRLRTMGDVARVFAQRGGMQQNFTVFFPARTEVCFYLAGSATAAGFLRIDGGVSECPRAEFTPTVCSIAEPFIELNHGELSSDRVNGHTASAQIHATCTRDYKVSLVTADEKSVLELGDGLRSELKINGVDLGRGYVDTLSPTPKTFTLTSTLRGSPDRAGLFKGTTVIIVGLP